MKRNDTRVALGVVALVLLLAGWGLDAGAGPLTRPGAPGDTMKTLQEVYDKADEAEARIPIPSIPFTISQSGSYYLAKNLGPAAQNTNGITVNADNVTIDLNGYSLLGAGKTAGTSGKGIVVNTGKNNLVVRNGTITSWRAVGIDGNVASRVVIERIRVTDCGLEGIKVGGRGQVLNNIITDCGSDGIRGLADCIIRGNTSAYNGGDGIEGIDVGNVIEDNVCKANGANGIKTGNDCTLARNQSSGHTAASGIEVGRRCVVRDNQCTGNKTGVSVVEITAGNTTATEVENNTCSGNTESGILLTKALGCTVRRNACKDNSNTGIGLLTTSTRNTIADNEIAGHQYGVFLAEGCEDNTVSNNVTLQCLRGIYEGGPAYTQDYYRKNNIDGLISEAPYVVWARGAYRLTNDIYAKNSHGITITQPGVALDLCGYTVSGNNPPGTSYNGITLANKCAVKNGAVQGFSNLAVNADAVDDCIIENIVIRNTKYGVYARNRSTVKSCTISWTERAIKVREGCSVLNNACSQNQWGVRVEDTGNIVADNHIAYGTFLGIDVLYIAKVASDSFNNSLSRNTIVGYPTAIDEHGDNINFQGAFGDLNIPLRQSYASINWFVSWIQPFRDVLGGLITDYVDVVMAPIKLALGTIQTVVQAIAGFLGVG